MVDFNITESVTDKGTLIEIFYADHKQGEIFHDEDRISSGTVQYIQVGSGMITLRRAVPESELSEYNVTLALCNYVNDHGGVDRILTPEFFGLRSYDAMRKAEKYDGMTKDEVVEECLRLEDTLNYCGY